MLAPLVILELTHKSRICFHGVGPDGVGCVPELVFAEINSATSD